VLFLFSATLPVIAQRECWFRLIVQQNQESLMLRTPLYEQHQKGNAKLVDFAGWEMPLHYGSQIEEHQKVRRDAGMFDVSHMAVIDISGTGACAFLRYLLANNVDRLQPGKALYSCMLNEKGGVIDDLIVYFVEPDFYRLVVNAGTREKDLAWIQQQANAFSVVIHERKDLAILAIQGPHACEKTIQALKALTIISQMPDESNLNQLKNFHFLQFKNWFVARTGYTGEHGFEVILPAEEISSFWRALLNAGVHPCGLGARDTLRLEAGLNLYGQDMDESISPLESNLAWTVVFDSPTRQFIGRDVLEKQKNEGVQQCLVGLVLEKPGVLRAQQKVMIEGLGEGEITSGTFSPTLGHAIALARIPVNIGGLPCHVVIRDKVVPVRIVKLPFVRNGKKVFE
jgi:aminomethyltransferase